MATALHETYTAIRRQAMQILGISTATSELSTNGVWFTDMMKSALRRAYWPGPVTVGPGHVVQPDWSFLNQKATLTVYGPYSTGTVTTINGSTTVTLADGTWPSWLSSYEDYPQLTITNEDGSTTTVSILSVDGQDATLTAAWSETTGTVTGLSYSLAAPESYGVHDSLVGPVLVTDPLPVREYPVTDWMRVRGLQAQGTGCLSSGGVVGLRPQTHVGSAAQAYRMNVYPQFDGTITYRYRVTPNALDVDETLPETYGYGPPWFHEVLLQSVLAVCQERRDGMKGLHWENFQGALVSAALADMRSEPDVFGTVVREGAEMGFFFGNLHSGIHSGSDEVVYQP